VFFFDARDQLFFFSFFLFFVFTNIDIALSHQKKR